MRYLLLIYANEAEIAKRTEEEVQENMMGYFAFTQHITEKGAYIGGEALQPTMTSRTVSVREGKTITTDGPFAETKEQLGGYYMLNVETEAEAIEYAAMIPEALNGRVEIRPIWEAPAG